MNTSVNDWLARALASRSGFFVAPAPVHLSPAVRLPVLD